MTAFGVKLDCPVGKGAKISPWVSKTS